MNGGSPAIPNPRPVTLYILYDLRSYPVSSGHLYDHLGGHSAEIAAVAPYHQGTALAVPQVHGGQHALDVVLQVVLLPLEHCRLPPEPIGTGPLVLKRRGLDRQNRDGVCLHPRGEEPEGMTLTMMVMVMVVLVVVLLVMMMMMMTMMMMI